MTKITSIICLMIFFIPRSYARLYLPDHLSMAPGYSMLFHASPNNRLSHGFHFNIDYGRSPSRVDKTDAFYYYVPVSYQYLNTGIHEFNMGIGSRYLFSRTNLINPYVGYEITFGQLFGDNYFVGFRNKAIAGINMMKVDKPILFLECSYHYSHMTAIFKEKNKNSHVLNISAGIRFFIDRCDCPRF